MGRPTNAQRNIESKAEIIDKLVKEIDPEIILAGALGAIAASGGITPPFTRLLMGTGAIVDGDMTVAKEAAKTWFSVARWASPIAFIFDMGDDSTGNLPADQKATARALAASGALEAMIMLSFAKNPEALRAVSEAIGGITKLPIP